MEPGLPPFGVGVGIGIGVDGGCPGNHPLQREQLQVLSGLTFSYRKPVSLFFDTDADTDPDTDGKDRVSAA
jgi:hypothetical protein